MEGGIVTFFTIYAMIIVVPCSIYNMVWIPTQGDKRTFSSYMARTITLREDVDIIRQEMNNISNSITNMELLMMDIAHNSNANVALKLQDFEKEFSAKLNANLTNITLNLQTITSLEKAATISMTNTLRGDVEILHQEVNKMSNAITKIELLMVDMTNKSNCSVDFKLYNNEKAFSAKLTANLTTMLTNFEKKYDLINKEVKETRLNVLMGQNMEFKAISAYQLEIKEEINNVDKRLIETIANVLKLQKPNVGDFELFANKTLTQINISTATLQERLEKVNKSIKLLESKETENNEAVKANKEIMDIVIYDMYNKYPNYLTGTFIAFWLILLGLYVQLRAKMKVLEDTVHRLRIANDEQNHDDIQALGYIEIKNE